ncbi:MAG: signal transduction histidine kinase nitrogen specific [Geobacteraceae bacterium]|nr:MAG: signal transduction histidine kinase nitrogen specific [Geobacteraceae bacterium]
MKPTSIRIGTYLNVVIGISFIATAIALVIITSHHQREEALGEAEEKALLILNHNLAIYKYFNEDLKPKLFTLSNQYMQRGGSNPIWMSSKYAIHKIDSYFKTYVKGDYYYKECAINARSPENEADEYEKGFIRKLNADKRLLSHSDVHQFNGRPCLVVLRRGEVMGNPCLHCHSSPEVSPAGLVSVYGREKGFHRKAGEVVSAISIRIPLSEAYKDVNRFSWKLSGFLVTLLLLLFITQIWLTKRLLLRPIDTFRDKAIQVAGDEKHLGEQISASFGWEFREMADAFNAMSLKLRQSRDHLEERVRERTVELLAVNQELQTEISERKRYEAELQRMRSYLSNIINSMPSILVGIEPDGTVMQWNNEAERATGITTEDALGKQVDILLPDFSPWIDALRSELVQHRPGSMEKVIIEREGERHFYDLMLYPLNINCVEGAVLRIEEVTERTRIQELIVQTEKMMSVGGLAAGMAHEINNPLGIIDQAVQNIERRLTADISCNRKAAGELGINLELLNSYFEKRQIKRFISNIREATQRAAKIVANMLQFSRQSPSIMQPVSLAELMDQAVELAANDYNLKKKYDFWGIEIVRDYQSGMTMVPVVVVEIEQVVLNLLKNAAQAMAGNPPERKPRITLCLREEEKYALLRVEDNGPGMEESVRRRVFEPFFTTKEPGVGTGLGLSVSYMIVTCNHKGFIAVDSSPGAGSRFIIRLPLRHRERK